MTNEPKVEATHAAVPVEQFNAMVNLINQSVPTGIGRQLLDCLAVAVPLRLNTAQAEPRANAEAAAEMNDLDPPMPRPAAAAKMNGAANRAARRAKTAH